MLPISIKKFLILVIATFAATWATNFLIHGIFMKELYMATANLWRPESDMKQFCVYMLGGQFLVSLFFAWIFVHGYKGTGWKEGLRYGIFMGAYNAGGNLIMYAVSPWECKLVCSWIVFGFAQAILVGILDAILMDKIKS